MHLASYLANTVSYKTVKLYLMTVQGLHRELNFPLKLIKMHRLQKALTGIKRLTPTKRLDRFPITLTVLHSIHSYLKPELSHNLDQMFWAAFTLASFGFLRSSEFTCNGPFDPSVHLTSNDIPLTQPHASPHQTIQTDLFRQGHTITIEKSSSPICSVMAMKGYLLQAKPTSSQPLFAFVLPKQWLTWNDLPTELRTVLQHCGLPANNFHSHSFRIRAATTAAKLAFHPGLLKF